MKGMYDLVVYYIIQGEAMSIYESMSVMLMFGMLIIALLNFHKKKN